jgi:hypothetical protein
MGVKDELAGLARHEGVWDGRYRHFDSAGRLEDEHASRVLCCFPDDGPWPYRQVNLYSWGDGRTQRVELNAQLRQGRLWWDNALVRGWATDLPMDEEGRTAVLYWQRLDDPALYVYEMIQLSDTGKKRARTWQWIRDGELVMRTAIEERLVSRDWRTAEAPRRKAA